jgi:pimeloyl-ACP methyl ester carboxylesterase
LYIEVNNIKIHYEVLGDGKPIILLNPNSRNTNSMKYIASKLSKEYKVYLFDRRCCGKSEINCKLTYDESAKDVYEFIKKLNIDKPFILGSSGGASVALFLATMYPESISKLVLCSGVARYANLRVSTFAQKIRKFTFLKSVREAEMFYKLNEEARELTSYELSKTVVPTLIVNGGKKDIVPIEEAKYLSNNIKNSKLIILENEGHFSYMMNCKWYDDVKSFLDE